MLNQIQFQTRRESGADNSIVRQGVHAAIILYRVAWHFEQR
jgi:hypothetical protein